MRFWLLPLDELLELGDVVAFEEITHHFRLVIGAGFGEASLHLSAPLAAEHLRSEHQRAGHRDDDVGVREAQDEFLEAVVVRLDEADFVFIIVLLGQHLRGTESGVDDIHQVTMLRPRIIDIP